MDRKILDLDSILLDRTERIEEDELGCCDKAEIKTQRMPDFLERGDVEIF